MTYKVDLVLTLDDREGRPSYNREVITRIKRFVNYPVNLIVSLHNPLDSTLSLFEKHLAEGEISKLHTWRGDIQHSPKDINRVYVEAFSQIESEYVCHFDGDMFVFRRGYDDWLERFIRMIDIQDHNVAAICHTMPFNRRNAITGVLEPRRQKIQWISTRFFVADAPTVKSALHHPRLFVDWPETYAFEGAMYVNSVEPKGLVVLGIPFNPDFLIVHVLGMAHWNDDMWRKYEEELGKGNQTLLRNISHSDWGDLYGSGVDCEQQWWGADSWSTSGNDGGTIDILN